LKITSEISTINWPKRKESLNKLKFIHTMPKLSQAYPKPAVKSSEKYIYISKYPYMEKHIHQK
jgi:hypothetical protein